MLRTLLPSTRIPFADRTAARRALRSPWCWPHDPALAAHAARHGFDPAPPEPTPGEVLLVSVAADGPRRALWSLAPGRAAAGDDSCPLVGEAREALELAERLAIHRAPLVVAREALAHARWTVTRVAKQGVGSDHALDGGSFGLSMLLASVSLLLARSVPATVAASASVRPDGTVGPVEGLAEKLALITGSALGVTTFLVAREQRAQAERWAGAALRIVGVATVDEAIDAVFPNAATLVPSSWDEPDGARAAARRLRRAVIDGEPVAEWKGIEQALQLLARRVPADDLLQTDLLFASNVVRRHRGLEPVPLQWPPAHPPRRDDLLRIAHALQTAADADLPELPEYLAKAQALLRAGGDHEAHVKLQGAVGRALAACGRHDEALVELAQAVEAWRELDRVAEASWPLCEWLRVLGLRGDRAGLEAPLACVRELARDPRWNDTNRMFAALAAGRALVQCDDAIRALEQLEHEEARWRLAPDHVRRSRLRWLAAALEHAGRRDQAAQRRKQLELEGADGIEVLLARLDVAIARGAAVATSLEAVVACEPWAVRRLLAPSATPLQNARRVAMEYPY